MTIREDVGLTYDDVLLIPKHSIIPSRKDVSTVTHLTHDWLLDTPIISANMDTITGADMAIAMHQLGGLGILHRFMDIETNITAIKNMAAAGMILRAFSIGVNDEAIPRLRACSEAGGNLVCIDVAHGHHMKVRTMVKLIKRNYPSLRIIAGNISTGDAARYLSDAGVDAVKVGIGPGSLCTTRIVTGHGVPQLTALQDVVDTLRSQRYRVAIIADGGIRTSGDIVKALAVGADTVMIGSLFAGTDETPGEVFYENTKQAHKHYRGMASRSAQENWKGKVSVIEGEQKNVPHMGPVAFTFKRLMGGVRSGFSYSGAQDISDLRDNAEFIRITNAGVIEGRPHGL